MTFDILGYLKYLKTQCDVYMDIVESKLTEQNPTFIEDLKKNKAFYNDDGSLKMDIKKEDIEAQIKELQENPTFTDYQYDQDLVEKTFLVDKELLKKFIIE